MFGQQKNHRTGFERMKSNFLVVAVCYVVFGLGLLIKPDSSAAIICYLIGTMAIIYAAVTLIKCFVQEGTLAGFIPNLILPIIAGIFGIVIIVNPGIIVSILPVIIGIILILSGGFKLQNSLVAKRIGDSNWIAILIFSLVSLGFGVVMLLNPFGTGLVFIRITGAFFMVNGIMDIISTIMMRQRH